MNKSFLRRLVDGAMMLLLPAMLLIVLTGRDVHKALGMAMVICFIIHNGLNSTWTKNLLKGKYPPVRKLLTAVNVLLFLDILCLVVSGIVIGNRGIFRPLIPDYILFFRQLHPFAGWWGLVLMSLHLGLNWTTIWNGISKKWTNKNTTGRNYFFRSVTILLSLWGIYAFFTWQIPSMLLMESHFTFYDQTKPGAELLLEVISMIVLFASIGFYSSKAMMSQGRKGLKN